MRSITAFLCAFTSCLATAQITLTSADLPVPGEEMGQYTDGDGGISFVPTPPGANQTWNWLTAFNITNSRGLEWLAPAGLPGAASFSSATVGFEIMDGYFGFYRADPTGFYGVGDYWQSMDWVETGHLTDALFLPTPFTSGSSRTYSVVETEITVYTNGDPAIKHVGRHEGTLTCDAWGMMYTPAYPSGTNVLRIVGQNTDHIDSSFTDATGTGNGPWVFSQTNTNPGYPPPRWFVRNGHPAFVASVEGDGEYAMYYSGEAPDAIGETHAMAQAQAFPVPSTDGLVHIRPGTHAAERIEVTNALGQVMTALAVQGADVIHLHTSAWPTGSYQFRCLDEQGAEVGRGRFIVEH